MAENFYRKFLKQKYSDIYKAFKHDEAHPHDCFYCGEPAEGTDHQPPLSRVDSYRGLGVGREFYVTVRCCEECNRLLGDALTVDLRERAELAHEALYRKYEKDLTCKLWNREKIKEAELQGHLKAMIESFAARQRWLMGRLEYSKGILAWEDWVLELYPDD